MELCRMCTTFANSENVKNLFERNQRKLLRQIKEIIGTTLQNIQGLPQHMCQQCEVDLEHAYQFRERCINAQQYFNTEEYTSKIENELIKDEQNFIDNLEPLDQSAMETINSQIETIAENSLLGRDEIQIKEEPMEEWNQIEYVQMPSLTSETKINNQEFDYLERSDITDVYLTPAKENQTKTFNKRASSKQCQRINEKEFQPTTADSLIKELKTRKIRKFTCEACDKHWARRVGYLKHMKEHMTEGNYTCKFCKENFDTKTKMRKHLCANAGASLFSCKYCQQVLSTASALRRHEITHTNERPYACDYCGRSFNRKHHLDDHTLIHTGERPFSCELCRKTFQRHSYLLSHNRSRTHKAMENMQNDFKNYFMDATSNPELYS